MLKLHHKLLLVVSVLVLAACGNMREQPKLDDPYGRSPTFDTAAREILPEAVAVGDVRLDEHLYTGRENGEFVETFPFEIDREMLEEGQDLYVGFCTPCHGYSGYGDGVVNAEGFPPPASYHTDELREAPVGRLYAAINEGKGAMFSYASRIAVEDRWAVVAYIRALQLSQNATLEDLPPELQAEFDALSSQ